MNSTKQNIDYSVAEILRQLPKNKFQVQLSYAPLVKKTTPAVVNIYARKVLKERGQTLLFNDPFFQRFFGNNFGLGRPRKRIHNFADDINNYFLYVISI